MKKTASSVAAIMPPITQVPSTCREMAPAPEASQSGTQPRMKANAVIRMGRSRQPCTGKSGVDQSCALVIFQLGELNDQNGVLGGQADEHDQSDLGVHVVIKTAVIKGDERPEDGDRHS